MIELKIVGETQSVVTDTNGFAVNATTSNTNAEMIEMRAAAKSTADDLKKLTALVATMASTKGGDRGGGNQKKEGTTHKCKHCKHDIYHKDANCQELEANKTNCHANQKSVFPE